MGTMQKRGKSGAVKNYVTRASALKKLQVSLADFRRLCILKGIFPRQPRHANRVGRQSSTFYYAKDIQFLLHEPVLQHLRDHKAFAKRLSRAIGRQNYALAQSIDQLERPTLKLDHLVRERYPAFSEAVHDMDDALSMLSLFSHLPAAPKAPGGRIVNHKLVERCSRLMTEWQVWCMHAHALRKIFLSIKGVYFQAEVKGQPVTWLVPYLFTQNVPRDVDFRIMVNFLDFYQTLSGFVLFKLYKDENLVYPPPLDKAKEDAGAGMTAITLTPKSAEVLKGPQPAQGAQPAVSASEVQNEIKAINAADLNDDEDEAMVEAATGNQHAENDAEFVAHPSKMAQTDAEPTELTTLAQLEAQRAVEEKSFNVFQPYYFYLSRETPRALLEFVLRSFGADSSHIGWDSVVGAGSALAESDPRITHHIIDRPVPTKGTNPYDPSRYGGARTFVQPQWLIDSANARSLLPTEPYAPGKTLPPHLSPFVDNEAVRARGGYVPAEAGLDDQVAQDAPLSSDSDSDSDEASEDEDAEDVKDEAPSKDQALNRPARKALLEDPLDDALLDQAELEAEAVGGEAEVERLRKVHEGARKTAVSAAKKNKHGGGKKKTAAEREAEEAAEAQKMSASLLSNKQRKLQQSIQRQADRRSAETKVLADKKKRLAKQAKRQ